MNNEKLIHFLDSYQKVAKTHVRRLSAALEKSKKWLPISAVFLDTAPDEAVAVLELLTSRFGKLQDVIGSKIFPLILEHLEETDALSFRDRLNKLEKLRIIESAKWWSQAKKLRNQLAHEYPDDLETLAQHMNEVIPMAYELLQRSEDLFVYLVTIK